MNVTNVSSDFELTLETLIKILDYSSDEIFVIDSEMRIIYVNKACEKHYGLKKSEVLGKNSNDLFKQGYWKPSIFPDVLTRKKPFTIKQTTQLGAELLTSVIPILNEQNKVEIIVTTARELQHYQLLDAKDKTNPQQNQQHKQHEIDVTNCDIVKHILKFSKKIAATSTTILIEGESGTGKGVLAEYIHQMSKRKNGPFLKINCSAIPEELLESELFGYTSGAFTGASRLGKKGLLEAAENGTLFLDEIGEMSLPLQAKLLQVIQDKKFIPVGSHKEKEVNIRIIAATNRNLQEMVYNREFREDLFYRLNVIEIHLPPLRERSEDIIPLTYNFLYKFNRIYEVNKLISESCLEMLTRYSWPGNVRQLENLIERLVITSEDIIDVNDLPKSIRQSVGNHVKATPLSSLSEEVENLKKEMVRNSFKKLGSSRKVANDLQISQSSASKLIRKYCSDLNI